MFNSIVQAWKVIIIIWNILFMHNVIVFCASMCHSSKILQINFDQQTTFCLLYLPHSLSLLLSLFHPTASHPLSPHPLSLPPILPSSPITTSDALLNSRDKLNIISSYCYKYCIANEIRKPIFTELTPNNEPVPKWLLVSTSGVRPVYLTQTLLSD